MDVRVRALRLSIGAAAVVAVALAGAVSPAYAGEPLRGQWHLDSFCDGGAPCTEPDSSGNGLDAPWVGTGFGDAPGRFNRAYAIGDDTSYLDAGDHVELQPANVTLIAWVKSSSTPPAAQIIAAQGAQGSCSYSSYALYTGGSLDPGLRFYTKTATGFGTSAKAPNTIWDNQFHMLAGTYDGANSHLYVDGVEVTGGGGVTSSTGDIQYGLGLSNKFLIGNTDDASCTDLPGNNFSGLIDETRVYSQALTATEIARLADPSAVTPPDLIPDPPPPPPPPPPRTRPTAAFTQMTERPKPFEPVTFDASASTPGDDLIARYDWDLTGDRKPDVSCSAENSMFTTNTLKSSVKSISLSVVDRNGTSADFSRPIDVASPTFSSRLSSALTATRVPASRLSGSPYVGGLCTPPKPTSADTTANGGPGPGCISQLIYGSFKATGCWRLVQDPTQLPLPTKQLLDEMVRPVVFPDGNSPLLKPPSRGGAAYGSLLDSPRGLKFPFGKAHASASFVDFALTLIAVTANSSFIADGPVRVNGLDVIPTREKIAFVGGGLLKDAKAKLISEGAKVVGNSPFGQLPMKQGELFERFGLSDNISPLGDLNIAKKLPLVPGLGIQGDVSAVMERGKLKVGANASLPKELGGITSRADLTASVEKGLELDYFKLAQTSQLPFGPLILKNASFEWIGSDKLLTAGLDATLLYKVGVGGTIKFQNGSFRALRVHADAAPGVMLGPGVFLSGLDAGYDTNGPVITGGGVLTLGPNPGGCPKAGVDGTATLDFNYPTTLSLVGAAKLACFEIAEMGAAVNENGYGSFFGRIHPDLSPLPVSIDGAIGGQIQVPINGKSLVFQIDAMVAGCIDLGKPFKGCLNGDLTVTDRAFAVCLDFGFAKAGLRLFYPPPASLANPIVFAVYLLKNFKILAPGCEVRDYRPFPAKFSKAPGKHASASAKNASFTMPAGRRGVVLAVHGEGGPPELVLKGPGGQTLDVPTHELVHNDSYAAFRLPYDNTTYVLINKPQAGDWSVELKPGSSEIKSLEMADMLPPLKLKAKVKKAGDRRELSYSINTRKGQSVRFVETAGSKEGQFLGRSTTKARGKIRFTPADSRLRKHTIIAYVEQDGAPRETITAAHFQAAQPKIGRAKVSAKRRGSKLAIKWSAAKNAQSYRVFVQLSDGRKLFFTPRKRRLVVSGVSKQDKATVTVIGERKGGRFGPKATGKIRATKKR